MLFKLVSDWLIKWSRTHVNTLYFQLFRTESKAGSKNLSVIATDYLFFLGKGEKYSQSGSNYSPLHK